MYKGLERALSNPRRGGNLVKYQVLHENGFHEVEGTRCLKKEFPNLHLFVHRDLNCKNTWNVSEAYTGMAAVKYHSTKKAAIQKAMDRLNQPDKYAIVLTTIERQKEKGMLTDIGKEALGT